MSERFSIVMTTTASVAKARELASAALEARLAACVQCFPIESRYVWRGEVREEAEIALHFKIVTDDYAALCALLRSRHDYETPEILRVDIADGDRDYLIWLAQSTEKLSSGAGTG
ncbi:MAG TPA: divalent-cation tolerance protein CutA [Methylocystis sp.]|nr:divalent-cation tolerance protein CutA [Methylocystis sp.]